MADWSIWKALEEWRNRRHELDPIFAGAGIAPEVESAVNLVCVNLKRQSPTPPLVTGDKMRDEEEFGRYHAAFYRHFDDSFQRAENLLRLPWVPEAAPVAEKVRVEIQRLRQVLHAHPGRNPGCSELENLLRHYVDLNLPGQAQLADLIALRRKQMVEVAGYPLLVQHALSDPYNDVVPPLSSAEFREELSRRMQVYRDTGWLHNRVITQAYVTLALDAAHACRKLEAVDDRHLARQIGFRWPALSVVWPGFEQADQLWYLLLIVVATAAILMEVWWLALPLMLWLNLSIGAHRREKREIEAKREQVIAGLRTMKRTRDRFASGQVSLEKLAFQMRQLDGAGEYFQDIVYELAGLHQHEA